jgi:hypothetical protein
VAEPIEIGRTGFQSTPKQQVPQFDPNTLSIRWTGGRLGYVWYLGKSRPVDVPGFCVGDPSYCGSALVIG